MRYVRPMRYFLLSFAILAGCSMLTKKIIDPKLKLENVRVGQADLGGAKLIFDVRVDNPNDFPLELDLIEYSLDFQDAPVGMGKIDKDLKVEKNASAVIHLPVDVQLKNLVKAMGSFLGNGTTPYRLKGKAMLGVIPIPFEESGDLRFENGKVERIKRKKE